MTKDDLIRMAREAGVKDWWDSGNDNAEALLECLERFADLITSRVAAAAKADEREALAQFFQDHWREEWTDLQIAEAIRARGQG